MKATIFACTDTHGNPPETPKGIDYLFHAGDLYNQLGSRQSGVSEAEFARMKNNKHTLTEWKKNLTCPAFFVNGNHDTYDLCGIMSENVTGKIHRLSDDLVLVGIGWSGSIYYELPLERNMVSICERLLDEAAAKMKNGDHSIILTHYPPYIEGMYAKYDEGYQFKTITKVVDALRPLMVVQGHLHRPSDFWNDYNGTKIIHPGRAGFLIMLDGTTIDIKVPQ